MRYWKDDQAGYSTINKINHIHPELLAWSCANVGIVTEDFSLKLFISPQNL